MIEKLEIKRPGNTELEIVEVLENERLYLVVPGNHMKVAVTMPLVQAIKRAIVRDELTGKLDHVTGSAIRTVFENPRLYTKSSPLDYRPLWGIHKENT